MNVCKDQENILKCIDAYDFNKKIMLFLEYMDVGALTQIVEERKGNIDEKICAYILIQILKGL